MSAALAQALQQILPEGLGLGWADPTALRPSWPGEAITAVPRRQAEFAAGRAAARLAMAALGIGPARIGVASDRAPVWPAGLTGSISHSATACLAVVGRASHWRGIGVDIELASPLETDLWPGILREEERTALGSTATLAAKLIFTAKEAVYKAQYAQSQTLFGFETLSIQLGASDFTATFMQPVPHFPAGSCLHGQHITAQGHLVSLVLIKAG